jgi:lipopolysaccharide export system protein LptC
MACLLPACGSSQGTEKTSVAPELKLERVRFRVWRGDALRARGEARQATIRKDTSQLWAEDVRAELPAGADPVVITAPAAQGLLTAGTFSAEGARYVPGPDGSDGQILGDDPVVVERGANRLSGVGFVFDPRRGLLEVGGPVSTEAAGEGR